MNLFYISLLAILLALAPNSTGQVRTLEGRQNINNNNRTPMMRFGRQPRQFSHHHKSVPHFRRTKRRVVRPSTPIPASHRRHVVPQPRTPRSPVSLRRPSPRHRLIPQSRTPMRRIGHPSPVSRRRIVPQAMPRIVRQPQQPQTNQLIQPISSADQQRMLQYVNALRAKEGLNPVCLQRNIIASTQGHSNYMAQNLVLTHNGQNNSNMAQRLRWAHYIPRASSENILYDRVNLTVEEAFNKWRVSTEHRKNMLLRSATHMGFARTIGPCPKSRHQCSYWTQVFSSSTSNTC